MKVRYILSVAKKDLRVEFRSKHTINFMFLFSLLTITIFSLALGFSKVVEDVGAGLLWVILLFTGMMGVSRAFIREKELGTLEGIRLSPIDPESILIGKIVYNLVLMLLVEIITFLLFIVMLNLHVENIPLAIFVLTLGIFGFVVVCSMLSVLVLNAKTRELLLPVILFPIAFPMISVSIHALRDVFLGSGLSDISGEIVVLLAYIIIMFTVSFLTFGYALEG